MYIILLSFVVCLILGLWVGLNYTRVIPLHRALIIRGRLMRQARRLVIGPAMTLVWPFEETVGLDLSMQTVHLRPDHLATADLVVSASLDIVYAFDPLLLPAANLDRLLPAQAAIPGMVQSWADHTLRWQVAGLTTAELLAQPEIQSGVAEHLEQTLQTKLEPFGVRLHSVRLLCQPVPTLLDAQLAAKRTELRAQAQAQALTTLATALGPDGRLIQLLALGFPPIWSAGQQHHFFRN